MKLLKLILWMMALKNNILFLFPPSFSWNLKNGTLQYEAQRLNSPEVLLSFFAFLFLWILKYAPKNALTAPRPKSVAQKQSFTCLSLSSFQTPHFLRISWSAKYDSSSRFWKSYIYFFPFIWQLVFFFITPGAQNSVTISKSCTTK